MEKQILLIEDEPVSQKVAQAVLQSFGKVQVATTCAEALEKLATTDFDLLVIDQALPDGNGIDLLTSIVSKPECAGTKYIFTTGDEDVLKKVAAFSLGADDYLVKPFSPLEFRARIERMFRASREDEIFQSPELGIKLNLHSYRAFWLDGEKDVDLGLTPHEFKILKLLMKNPDRIFSRSQIIDVVWGSGVFVGDRTVDAHISGLRKKLKQLGALVASVRGEGYKLSIPEKAKLAKAA